MSKEAYLALENRTIFRGKYFGAETEVTGEIVFTTGMTGYLETLTDKSYFGQIVLQTFPLIGNYGVISPDFESGSVGAGGYIVKSWCREPSNFRSEDHIDSFLKSQGITGLYDIDTRALTRLIREYGVMNGKITCKSPVDADFEEIRSYSIKNAVARVSTGEIRCFGPENPKYKVALLDFGLKENIKRELIKRDCRVWVLPYDSKACDIQKIKPDGIMLSNGPGDPAENTGIIENLKGITALGIPIFGICLGHQLLALASGFKTHKLKYGHRGANQPVRDMQSKRVYITSQNHGYAVVSGSIDPEIGTELFVNVNDKTCEGITYRNLPVFSVQFHPEACGGPLDTAFLFDRFIKNMEVYRNAAG